MTKKIIVLSLIVTMILSMGINAFAFQIDGASYIKALQGVQKKIPAIMYHKITENPDEVTDFVVTDKMLADDFAEMQKRGYTPITVGDFYYIRKKAENIFNNSKEIADFFAKYPKPIIITFDDGYEGIYTYVLPLMKQYNFRVSFFICGELIDNKVNEYCTWEQIKALNDSGLAEIGNHTYSLHNKSKEELNALYKADFATALLDISKNRDLLTEKTGVYSTTYSFPYGQYDPITLAHLQTAGYRAFVSTDYRVNFINDRKATLGRFNRAASIPTKDYFDMVNQMCWIG